MLLESGIIDAAQLQAALGHQRRWGGRLGQALVDLKITSEPQIVDALSRKLGYDPIRLAAVEHGTSLELALQLVPHEFAQRNQLLPYAADMGTIWVAMADPTNVALVDEIAFRTGRKVKVSLAGDREIAEAVRRLYLMEKRGIEAIALADDDTGPVEMVGSFGGGTTQALDEFFSRSPAPPPVHRAAPTEGGAPVPAAAANPAPVPASEAAPPTVPPPTAPGRSAQGIPPAGAAARLAEAVRGIRLEDETTAARPVAAAGQVAAPPTLSPVQLVSVSPMVPEQRTSVPLDVPGAAAGVPDPSPRLQALLDALDRVARGDAPGPEVARLARVLRALVRLLVGKGILSEDELVSEFLRR